MTFEEYQVAALRTANKELGDVLWYVAVTADAYGLDLDDIAEANIAKLKARYPEGFDTARSRNRPETYEQVPTRGPNVCAMCGIDWIGGNLCDACSEVPRA